MTRLVLTSAFERALAYAAQLHRHQWRKVNEVPYVSHLLAVAALVLEDGGSEAEAIAALLHDAVEDQGGLAVLTDIQARFGAGVAALPSWVAVAATGPHKGCGPLHRGRASIRAPRFSRPEPCVQGRWSERRQT